MNAEKKPDALVAELAGRQHGVVARRQLIAEGVSPKFVDRHIASGRLRPVHRGVYLLGSLRGPLEPLRAREMAAVLACGRGAVLSHQSAGWLWGLIRRPGSSEPPEVTIPEAARRQRPGVRIRRGDLSSDEIRRLDGLPVTAPGRTIRDLAAVLDPRALGRAAARG
ncbi:MAG: type IV toxin-antitoxin system AbiEi family antitoxin domain-containing protein, partial [Longimicrobiales bacterium]|nr:type IV toxin-antitoxin system AbiEi family antitoxin domain-containing protein [Longimicrobiales bacterium]